MIQSLKIFFWGMFISFLGSLPLGTMNVTATNVAVKDGINAGLLFTLGALTIETICLCITLLAMEWVRKQQRLFRVFEWLTAILIFTLAFASFVAAYKMKAFGDSAFTAYNISPFLLGLLLSALNPMHIPFWFGWTTILINKNVLLPGLKNYLIYVMGISIGTVLGFAVFVYGGNYIIEKLADNQNILNWIIGIVLLVTALIQLYKIIYKTPAVKTA
ncbi:MAG TPA: LysE family transporter [Panacibacter sp.]|nr:LysE family transporter [Panacibacter sp.]